jgi:hypothetical protein
MPDPGAQRSGGMGGRGGGGRDDIREAARTVAAIASARAAPRGALERLGAQRVSAAQSGPRGALERVAAQRAAAVRAPTVRAGSTVPQKTIAQKVYDKYLHPQKTASALLGITSQEWVDHVTKPVPGNVTINAPATAPARTRFAYASRKASDFLNKSNIRQNLSNPSLSGAGIAQLVATGLLGGLHQGWQGIQNMNDPNSPGHQFGAFDWRSYPNLVDFGGNMAGLLGFGTKVD